MPYLLFSKKRQNLKLSSAANYRWRFMGKYISPGAKMEFGYTDKYDVGKQDTGSHK